MLSRRDLVGRLAAGAAGVAALAAGTRAGAAVDPDRPLAADDVGAGDATLETSATNGAPEQTVVQSEPAAEPPWELLQPLTAGTLVAHGWKVVDLSAPESGACILSLQNERGRVQRIHLCRNGGKPRGLVHTQQLDMVVMNGGQGDLGTDEGLAQAIAEVSHVLATNEASGRHASVISSLLSHDERLQRFSAESEWALR